MENENFYNMDPNKCFRMWGDEINYFIEEIKFDRYEIIQLQKITDLVDKNVNFPVEVRFPDGNRCIVTYRGYACNEEYKVEYWRYSLYDINRDKIWQYTFAAPMEGCNYKNLFK